MDKMLDLAAAFFIGILMVLLIIAIFHPASKYYKQGQIDALTGKIKYELVVKDDSTRVWEKSKEKGCQNIARNQ